VAGSLAAARQPPHAPRRRALGQPRGSSHVDYQEHDEWRVSDLVCRLRFEQGSLVFDADYVRGRMVKTTVTVAPTGKVVVETTNRHEMAVRWLRALKGKKHIRLIDRGAET
jgi:hypothetical protein